MGLLSRTLHRPLSLCQPTDASHPSPNTEPWLFLLPCLTCRPQLHPSPSSHAAQPGISTIFSWHMLFPLPGIPFQFSLFSFTQDISPNPSCLWTTLMSSMHAAHPLGSHRLCSRWIYFPTSPSPIDHKLLMGRDRVVHSAAAALSTVPLTLSEVLMDDGMAPNVLSSSF